MQFTIIDMQRDPTAKDRLLKLGVRRANVIVNPEGKFVIGKNWNEVADFVGIPRPERVTLPADQLFDKWIRTLRIHQRNMRLVPDDQMDSNATELRKRSLRTVCHHVFHIGEVFLECTVKGHNDIDEPIVALEEDSHTAAEIIRYGEEIIGRLEKWWQTESREATQRKYQLVHYGLVPFAQMLERCTWHSAHHARQIIDVLERQGIMPAERLSKELLSGLPMPKQIWA